MLTVDYDKLGVRPGDRLLDLGCGFGRHAFEAARRGASVVALDAGPEEVAQVRGTLGAMVEAGELAADHPASAVQGDALALPFPDASFDRVIASEVLEHIPDDVAAMRELARVLRPGGTMAVTVPRCGPEAINWALSDEYHDTPGGHVRIYRRSTLERRLTDTLGAQAHTFGARDRRLEQLAARNEIFPSRILDEADLTSTRRQTQIGVVVPQEDAMFRP